ncbi:MAG: hypothetical protein FJ033_16145 [Chloroflexi bacterium]|nr:hypothetical protein [Chloroflexota bacterium]
MGSTMAGRTHLRCGARARSRGGAPCRAPVVPGRARCKLHGGRSTGPRTAEGRMRGAEASRLRAALQPRVRGRFAAGSS